MASTLNPQSRRPLVSVLLATYNEARYIEGTVASILRQHTPDFDLELLVMDGRSNDGTAEIVAAIAARDPRVRLLVNEKRAAPSAFNLGLQAARGEYVCIFGAHTRYKEDYISSCLRELLSHQAIACGGRVLTAPANQSRQAQLVAWALAHPFGSSRKSFRTQQEGYVDIVNYPVVLKQALLDAGGYDESLIRNEDNDMFQKLRARGHRLYCTWQTSCTYHPAPDVRSLVRYAFRNGFWNALSLKTNPSSMSPRYFVPALFVITLLLLLVIAVLNLVSPGPKPLLALLGGALLLVVYGAAALVASCMVAARDRRLAALLLPFVFFLFHCSYGTGTLCALLSGAEPPRADSMANVHGMQQTPEFAFTTWNGARGKRIFDLIFSSVLLLLLLPLLVLIAILVRLTSPGPVLFRQYRVGQDGSLFQLLKFRTMYERSEAGPALTMRSDSRVTPTGRFLRKLKLDELPQLVNVARGEMTFVGPRPDLEEYLAELPPDLRCLNRLRPGITGAASLCYRDEEAQFVGLSGTAQRELYVAQLLPAKARLDLDYASRASCAGDLKLIAKTVLAVFARSGRGQAEGRHSDLRIAKP